MKCCPGADKRGRALRSPMGTPSQGGLPRTLRTARSQLGARKALAAPGRRPTSIHRRRRGLPRVSSRGHRDPLQLSPQDGRPLTPGPRLRLQALGTRRLLQLRRCGPLDAGTYSCAVGAARAGPVRLLVRGGCGALPGPGTAAGGASRAGAGRGRGAGGTGVRPAPTHAPAPPQSAACRCSPGSGRCTPARGTAPRSSAPCRRWRPRGAGSSEAVR